MVCANAYSNYVAKWSRPITTEKLVPLTSVKINGARNGIGTSIGDVVVSALLFQPSRCWFESPRGRLIHRPMLTGKVGRVNLLAEARVR